MSGDMHSGGGWRALTVLYQIPVIDISGSISFVVVNMTFVVCENITLQENPGTGKLALLTHLLHMAECVKKQYYCPWFE